jgi:uncharacterized membrane protein
MNTHQILYGISILLTGLVAGLFFGFQCSIINGLGALGNKEYLLSFQSINKVIQNPVFFIVFMGPVIVLPIACYINYKTGSNDLFPYLLTSTLIYLVAVFGITITCNVPLNDMLDGFNIQSATGNQLQDMRLKFEAGWNKWHLVRTIASIIAFLTLIIPLLKRI